MTKGEQEANAKSSLYARVIHEHLDDTAEPIFNDDAEFELDDSGNFTISPSSSTSCDLQVNQAASASGLSASHPLSTD